MNGFSFALRQAIGAAFGRPEARGTAADMDPATDDAFASELAALDDPETDAVAVVPPPIVIAALVEPSPSPPVASGDSAEACEGADEPSDSATQEATGRPDAAPDPDGVEVGRPVLKEAPVARVPTDLASVPFGESRPAGPESDVRRAELAPDAIDEPIKAGRRIIAPSDASASKVVPSAPSREPHIPGTVAPKAEPTEGQHVASARLTSAAAATIGSAAPPAALAAAFAATAPLAAAQGDAPDDPQSGDDVGPPEDPEIVRHQGVASPEDAAVEHLPKVQRHLERDQPAEQDAGDGGTDGGFPQPVSGPLREHLSPHAPTAHGSAPVDRLAHRIVETAVAAEGRSVDIVLGDDDLGSLRMKLVATEDRIALTFLADRPETRELLRRHIDTLAQDFRDLGYTSVAFDFGASDRQPSRAAPFPVEAPPDGPETRPAIPALFAAPRAHVSGAGLDIRI